MIPSEKAKIDLKQVQILGVTSDKKSFYGDVFDTQMVPAVLESKTAKSPEPVQKKPVSRFKSPSALPKKAEALKE